MSIDQQLHIHLLCEILHICLIIDCYEITLQRCPRALLWLGHFVWFARVGAGVFLKSDYVNITPSNGFAIGASHSPDTQNRSGLSERTKSTPSSRPKRASSQTARNVNCVSGLPSTSHRSNKHFSHCLTSLNSLLTCVHLHDAQG